jgi:transposase
MKCAVSYGPRLHAIGAYLLNVHYLPVARTAALFKDVFHIPASTGWVSTLWQKTSALLADTVVLIRQAVTASTVAHVDETGLREAGALAWVHCASTTTHTVFHGDQKRGLTGTLNGGVLQLFTGVMVHDGWGPYSTFTAATHGLCNAHHLRELQKIIEDAPDLGWAKQMTDFLVGTHREVQAAKARGHTGLGKKTLDALWQEYGEILTTGNVQSPARVHPKTGGRVAQTEPRRLLNRLGPHQEDVLRFTTDFTVPFDNNQAERDIRMIKLRQKVSGCLRSTTGAEHFVSIRSVMSTARKQAVNEFEVLLGAFTGNSWIPARP